MRLLIKCYIMVVVLELCVIWKLKKLKVLPMFSSMLGLFVDILLLLVFVMEKYFSHKRFALSYI